MTTKRFDDDGTPAEQYERVIVPRVFLPLAREVVAAAALSTGERVLDVACGTGALTRLLAAGVGPTGSVVGLDVNAEMLSVAAMSVPDRHVEWRQASASELPFAEATFDLVTCQHGVQYFPDRTEALGEMRRVLREGGRLVLTCWRASTESPAYLAVERWLTERSGTPTSLPPFCFADSDEFCRVVDAAGFTDVQLRTVPLSVHYPAVEIFVRSLFTSPGTRAVMADVGEEEAVELISQVEKDLAPYSSPDGSVTVPQGVNLLSAQA